MKVQEYIEENYPKEGRGWQVKPREQVTNIDLYGRLEGHLDLKEFPEAKELEFSGKEITSLDLSNNKELEVIKIFDNYKLNGDLSIFSHLTKLKYLSISRCPFTGNLKSLHNCTKLEVLHIQGTQIVEGLEYLPLDNLKEFWCSGKLKEELKPFNDDVRAWKLANYPHLFADSREKIEKEIAETQKKVEKLAKSECYVQCGYTWHFSDCLVKIRQDLETKVKTLQKKLKEIQTRGGNKDKDSEEKTEDSEGDPEKKLELEKLTLEERVTRLEMMEKKFFAFIETKK